LTSVRAAHGDDIPDPGGIRSTGAAAGDELDEEESWFAERGRAGDGGVTSQERRKSA